MVNDFIDGNKFKELADFYLDEDKQWVSKEDLVHPNVIFVKTDYLNMFIEKIFPLINNKFKLITHNSDISTPAPWLNILEHEKIIHWYGMNANINHKKFTSIPIGVANDKWDHGNKKLLTKVINKNITKDKLVYSNFDITTSKSRYFIDLVMGGMDFVDYEKNRLSQEEYWDTMSKYKYVISPPGNSIDCHRIWEAIYLGVIPIISSHVAMEKFHDLPILVVEDWLDLSVEYLEEQYTIIKSKNKNKAYFEYYRKLIK
jgi:hypothetical protein